jgi:hypothetical protein
VRSVDAGRFVGMPTQGCDTSELSSRRHMPSFLHTQGETVETHYKQLISWPSFDPETYLTRSRGCVSSAVTDWSHAPAKTAAWTCLRELVSAQCSAITSHTEPTIGAKTRLIAFTVTNVVLSVTVFCYFVPFSM